MKNRQLITLASILFLVIGKGHAGLTDLSDTPMANSNPAQAKPNIMLLMDTSSSMGWTHMPDQIEGVSAAGTKTVGYKSPQCNGIYYNPNTVYGVPKKADGTSQATPAFTAARYDPYDTVNTATTDLTSAFKAYDGNTLSWGGDLTNPAYNDTPQAAYYYLYTGSQTLSPTAAPCTDIATGAATQAASGGGTWRKVTVSATSGPSASDERQNFANWYTYYRTRMLMVKSAASLAFNAINDGFRVGFVTVFPKNAPADSAINSGKYLAIADFNTTQRGLWFDKLFSQKPLGASPAREGLARVGRHYAGKTDGINSGMTGDPVQYSCQQNFTILTTDGYWNDQFETPGRGPVGLDGTTRVGQQDGTLTDNSGWTPRPIWEGFADSQTVETNQENFYYFDACATGYFDKTTTQFLQSTQQTLQHTSQVRQGTLTRYKRTEQQLRSTVQKIAHTVQNIEVRWQNTQEVTKELKSTTQNLRSTSQTVKSTYQDLRSKVQVRKSTTQLLKSTTQVKQTTTAWKLSQSAIRWRNPATESWERVASCPTGGECTTETIATNTPVASCTSSGPTLANGYVTSTCVNSGGTTGVVSCTAQTASALNGYVGITCNTTTTSNEPSASCTAATASSGNDWTTTTCTSNNTGPTLVASCTAASANSANSYTSTTCTPNVIENNVPVNTCTPEAASSGNSYTTTLCATNNQLNIPVASCTPSPESSSNSWTQTVCPAPITTTNVAVDSCTAATASSGNGWTTTTCSTNNTGPTPVASCTPQSKQWWNSYTATTCTTQTISPWTVVVSCTPVEPDSSNGFQRTRCGTKSLGSTPVQTCTPQTPSPANGYVAISCSQIVNDTPVAACTPSSASSGNAWTTTTCPAPITTTNVPVASCTPATAASGNAWTTTTCSVNATSWAAVASCVTSGPDISNNFTSTFCNNLVTPGVGVSACTPVAPVAGNGFVETTCTPVVNEYAVASCSPSSPTSGNAWVTTTCVPNNTSNVPVASCSNQLASAGNQWTTTTCTTNTVGPNRVSSCTAASANPGNSYVQTACVPVMGDKGRYRTTTTVKTRFFSGGIGLPERTTTTSATGAPADMNGICYAAGVPAGAPPSLPSPNPQAAGLDISPWPTIGPMPPAGCSGWPCSVGTALTGGSIDTLADVAQYYYVNDLRPTMEDNVPSVGTGPEDDRAKHQHMSTFTLALGVSGTLNYRSDYKTATIGDFAGIRTGAKNWPLWPDPDLGDWNSSTKTYASKSYWENPRSIDDFWHAAVNGRGQFFSASTPTAVVTGLTGALSGIQARLAAGAAAGTSTLTPVAGDNFYFAGRYTSSKWTGELEAKTINVATGGFNSTAAWSAAGKLNAATGPACDNRSIYLIRVGAPNNLVPFSWDTYACNASYAQTGSAQTGLNATEQAEFGTTNAGLLSQYGLMTDGTNGTVNQKTPTEGANLVNFLRGQRQFEGFEPGVAGKYYRTRDGVLGDIVTAQPVYVKKPFANYADLGYDSFKTSYAARTPVVYVGANDGMLHAFKATVYQADGVTVDTEGGKELWAVIPSSVLPNLYKLADSNYANNHSFFVDGTPTVADIDTNAPSSTPNWKTILVGGLNKGGKGYYALDVTNPTSPKALWEFKWGGTCWNGATPGVHEDCHLGYSYGTPIVTKLENGQWVVLVTSGYNNVNSPAVAGDGKGYLYVLNANTGALMLKLATTAGSDTTPSGLAQASAFVEDASINNMTERVYGTDLAGNLWRFRFNFTGGLLTGGSTVLIGTAKDGSGVAQPITIKPVLTEYKGETIVMFGTGKLLGVADLDSSVASNSQTQSVYAVKDPEPFSSTTLYSNMRNSLAPLSISQSGTTRTIACTGTATECDRDAGWVLNLKDTGERVNVDMRLAYGTLVFASNVPSADACKIGGYSWLNYVNYRTGMKPSRMPDGVSTVIQDGLTVGVNMSYINDGNGQLVPVANASPSNGDPPVMKTLVPDTPPLSGRRTSWREIIAQ